MSAASRFESLLLRHPSAPWDWAAVSYNPAVSFQFIIDHPEREYPWDFETLCSNPNLSLSFFVEFIIKPEELLRVDWHLLSANPAISMVDVATNSKYKWDDRYLSANPNLTSNFILNEGRDRQWFVPSVCANPGITARDIFKSTLRNIFDWDYRNLSANPNLPIKFVDDNRQYPWNFHTISTHASLTDIQTYPRISWDPHGLSMNEHITLDYVRANSSIAWHLPSLLSNNSVAYESVVANHEWFVRKWSGPGSMETYLSSNATVTDEWIDVNARALDWTRLSRNRLGARLGG